MSRFASRADRAMGAVDREYSELVSIHPMSKGAADPARTVVEIQAVLRTGKPSRTHAKGGRSSDWQAQFVGSAGQLRVRRAAYPTLVLREGDIVTAKERDGMPNYRVGAVDDRSHGRLIAALGAR